MNSPHKGPVTRKRFPFDDVIMLMVHGIYLPRSFNSSPPGQNGRLFADDILRCSFVNEKFCILIKISLKFPPKCLIDNNPALV